MLGPRAAALLVLMLSLTANASRARAEEGMASAERESAASDEVSARARPGVLNDAASLPSRYRGYVVARGGMTAFRGSTALTSGLTAEGSGLFSFAPRLAVSLGVASLSGAPDGTSSAAEGARSVTPWMAVHAQLLAREPGASRGFDVTASIRYRTLGPEVAGSQVAGRVNVGYAAGPLHVVVNGTVGQALGERGDVDVESGSMLYVQTAHMLRLGAEARVRGELVDRYATAEDEGRPIEALTGAVVGLDLESALVQALAGWSWPRGPLPSSPAALASATLSF